jgi:hypothetical protein
LDYVIDESFDDDYKADGGLAKRSLAVGSGGAVAAGRFVGTIAHTVPL